MDPYKPYGTLRGFIYSVDENVLYLDASVTVLLPAGETLSSRNAVYDPSTHTASKKYDHVRSGSQLAPYHYVDNFRVGIVDPVAIPYTPNNQAGFIASLQATLANLYSVSFIVNPVNNDPNTGGSSTNTIDNGGSISII